MYHGRITNLLKIGRNILLVKFLTKIITYNFEIKVDWSFFIIVFVVIEHVYNTWAIDIPTLKIKQQNESGYN